MTAWSTFRDFRPAVLADWEDFPREFLKKTGKLSPSFPCEKTKACYMDVVHHSKENIVGICSSELQFCESRQLAKEELYIYAVDVEKLAGKIVKMKGFAPQFKELLPFKNLWLIGWRNLVRTEGKSHLYLSLEYNLVELEKMVFYLNESTGVIDKFIFITLNKKLFSSPFRKKCKYILETLDVLMAS